jgi:PAS domain S-box-containing protein
MDSEAKVDILLVDDQPANLLVLEAALAELGQNLVHADSGEEALSLLLKREFAVILLDIQMKGLDGFETAKFIRGRERTKQTPIIFLTAYDNDPRFLPEAAYALGAVDFLVKPVMPIVLRAKVAGFIELFRKTERAAKAEANAREQLRHVLATVNDMFILLDRDLRYTYVNDRMVEASGIPRDKIVGKAVRELFPDTANSELERELQRALAEKQPRHFEFYHASYDRWFDNRAYPSSDGLILVTSEITSRKKAEEALRQKTSQLQIITESMAAPVAWCSCDLKYLWVSKPYADWIGRPINEIVGRSILEIIGPKAFEQLRCRFQRVIAGEVVQYEQQIHYQGIGPRWVNAVYRPTVDGGGSIDGWVAVVNDVNDRKKMEEALKASEERLASELQAMTRLHALGTRLLAQTDLRSALGDVLQDAVLTTHADFGNIQLLNTETNALEISVQLGFRQDFLEHFRSVRLNDGSASARALQSGRRIIIEDVNMDDAYKPHRRIAAAASYRAVQSTPLMSRHGNILGMLSTHLRQPGRVSERDQRLLDLYARHAADFIERLRIEETLKEADRRKDEFLATLAHELRNPLAPIRNSLQVMRMAGNDELIVEQSLGLMGRQLGQMVRLIDDLMDVSRISRGKVNMLKEHVRLDAVLTNAIETSRPVLEHMGHELTVTMPKSPIVVDADPTRLAQVFVNLLNNSAKYTERGGHIWLTVRTEANEVAVSVKDDGIGIAAEQLHQVFEMFSQVHHASNRSQGGLGIGLTLAKRLVEMHDGMIEARSEGSGKGAEFIVRLPLVVEPAGRLPARVDVLPFTANCSLRILVVDDNEDGANSMSKMLSLMGNTTRTAYDGEEAVAAAADFQPDVILLDVGLPKMDGCEACLAIRRILGEGVFVIALTGWGQDDDRQRTREAGFNLHMVKPVDPESLIRILVELEAERVLSPTP